MPSRHRGLIGAAALAIALAPGARADGPYYSDTASVTWEDNVTTAPPGDGIRSAFTMATGGAASWIDSLGFSTLLVSSLSADLRVCSTFRGLDNAALGPRFEVRHKVGVGPQALSLYAGLAGTATGYDDPERSNIEGTVLFGGSKRLSDEVQLVVDGRLGSYDARDVVFTGNYASLTAAVNIDLDETWRLRLLGGWRDGDTVAGYTAYKSPYGWDPGDSGALELPGAWHYVATYGEPFVDYRVSARTWSCGCAVSPALGRNTSLTLQYMRFDTVGPAPYIDNVVSLSLAHKY